MKILFIAPRLPLPADTGAKIRTYNLLKTVASCNRLTLLCFYFEDDPASVSLLEGLGIRVIVVPAREKKGALSIFNGKPISIAKYFSSSFKDKLKAVLQEEKYDLVHCDHLHMAQYANCLGGLPVVMDEHNVEAVILRRYSVLETNPVKRIILRSQAEKMAIIEKRIAGTVNRCFVVSDNDREELQKLADGQLVVDVIPNGVDTGFFDPAKFGGIIEEDALVFTGSMDWLPNSDAITYFFREILPLVWAKKESVKLYVVGRNPSADIIRLGKSDKRIVITGRVDDVRDYMAKAKVFVVPLRVGGGTRLKILEAMSIAKPVISTALGAEGIAYSDGRNIVIRDSPEGFAASVLHLLNSKGERESLGQSGRRLVCEKYDWKIIGKKINAIYHEVARALN